MLSPHSAEIFKEYEPDTVGVAILTVLQEGTIVELTSELPVKISYLILATIDLQF